MSYPQISYQENHTETKKKPLMIGCSGGGGHIAAILGLYRYLISRYGKTIDLPQYVPILYREKPTGYIRTQIKIGANVASIKNIEMPIRAIIKLTSRPVLPNKNILYSEVMALSDKEEAMQQRPYVDMLLDVYSAGYESAAIWNVLQRHDQTTELQKLVRMQKRSDYDNYSDVYNYYFKILTLASRNGSPYTEIISTQAISLPALCDAVKNYNNFILQNTHLNAHPIKIHQYMTDLPTKGAIHFFNPLSELTREQQEQINLYGVGMTEDIIHHFFQNNDHFNAIYDIPLDDNPMVRPGFKAPELDNSSKFNQQINLTLAAETKLVTIEANEQIASIMLGSQASNDTVEYIGALLENGMDKVFVFGGKTPSIKEKIDKILEKHPEYTRKIIPLGNQGDREMAPLMSRSNIVIIRGGGLSVMEQLAMNHHQEQTVFIHHANAFKKELTSGISWEDDNVTALIDHLKQRGIHTEKTSPERATRQIAESRLITHVKRLHLKINIEDATQHIKKLHEGRLKFIMEAPDRAKALNAYFKTCEQLAQQHIEILNEKLKEGQNHLTKIIFQEVAKLNLNEDDLLTYTQRLTRGTLKENIDIVFENFKDDLFKHASTKFFTAVQSYRAIQILQSTISPEKPLSANQKLNLFKQKYQEPSIKRDFLCSGDHIILRIFKEILYQLSKIFPALNKHLSFQHRFQKHMTDLIENDYPNDSAAFKQKAP